jgi:hypothetical protein
MANKQKKKRNKVYRGAEAAISRPVITKVTAVNRSKVGQWLYDRRQFRRPVLIATGVVAAIALLTAALIQVLT